MERDATTQLILAAKQHIIHHYYPFAAARYDCVNREKISELMAHCSVSLTSRSVRYSRYASATAIQKAGSTPIWRSIPLLTSRSPVVRTENVGVRSVNVNRGTATSPR